MFSLTAAPVRITRIALAAAVALAAFMGMLATSAAPAEAARQITLPGSLTCSGARIGVAPPRVWANQGRPETVAWVIQVERWNGSRWYRYSEYRTFSTFNYFGQSLTSWSGGRFVNSRYWVPVQHRGHYRIGTVVATATRNAYGYVQGGAYCTVR